MKRIFAILLLAVITTSCSGNTPEVATATSENNGDQMDAALTFDLVMPENAQHTPSGLAYVAIKQSGGTRPTEIQALRIALKAYDVMTGKIEEATVIETLQRMPLFGEIVSQMTIGDTYRIWGESEGRVWDVTILEVAHEFDPPQDLTPPADAEEINGAVWKQIEAGNGVKITHGQAIRFYATRWHAQTGAILESNISGEGTLAILNNDMFYQDPIHAALLLEMSPGAKARIWIKLPQQTHSTETQDDSAYDILEELTVVERLPQYDVPTDLVAPQDATTLREGAAMKIIDAPQDGIALKEGEDVLVDMTCWHSQTGNIIMASGLLSNEETRMELTEALGIWHDFMLKATHGMTFRTWTTAEVMPENVTIPMTCRVKVE